MECTPNGNIFNDNKSKKRDIPIVGNLNNRKDAGGGGGGSGDGGGDIDENNGQQDLSYINPFVHKLALENPIDIIKTYILTVILLPIRLVLIIIFLLLAWSFACIGLYELSPEDLRKKPIQGWRKMVKRLAALSMRGLFAAGSFTYVKYKGVQASAKEAPILCVAPHSSYVDSIVVVVLGPPSIVAKAETSQLPFFGKLINFSQPIYVLREDPNSRQNSIKEIISRANSKEDWPQIVIFPEGTCTNRSALITFKPGAFYPGVPIQPVLLRYPNPVDTYTWTWDGPGALKLLWLTMTKLHNACEIEFLPVYKPSEEEKTNPKLYARNVRDYMAKALGVPTSEFSYDDCIIMTNAKEMQVPFAADIVEIDKLRKELNLKEGNIEENILSEFLGEKNNIQFTKKDFSERLGVSLNNSSFKLLFSILDETNCGSITLRDYLLCAMFLINQEESILDFLISVAKIYGLNEGRTLSKEDLYKITKHSGKMSREETNALYIQIVNRIGNDIKFDHFVKHAERRIEYSYLLAKGKLKKQ